MNARVADMPQPVATSLTAESPLGDLLAQCLYRWSKLDGAIINSDSIRNALPEGRVTEYDCIKHIRMVTILPLLPLKAQPF